MTRFVTILVLLGGCLMVALSGGLARRYLGGTGQYRLVPASATDIQYDRLSATQQRVTYQLPPGWTLRDVRRDLAASGWLHTTLTERARQADGTDNDDRRTVFTQRRWFGRMELIAVVGYAAGNRRRAEILVSSCLMLERQGGCWQAGRGGPLAERSSFFPLPITWFP